MTSENPQENRAAPSEQRQPKEHTDNAHKQVAPRVTELKPPITKDKCPKSCKEKKHWLDYATFVVEIFGLAGLVVYAALTYGIWCANKKVAEDTHRSVVNAENSFKLDERAWVGVSTPTTQNPVLNIKDRGFSFEKVSVILRNSGKTPALKVDWTCCFNLERAPSDPIPDFDAVMAEQQRRLAMNPGTQIDKGNILYEGLESREGGVVAPATEEPTILIKGRNELSGPTVIYVLGEMTYQDIFSAKRHTTKFCLQNSGAGFSFCREGNWMD